MRENEYTQRPYMVEDFEFVYDTKKVAYKKYVEMNWGEWDEPAQRKMFEDFLKAYAKDIKILMCGKKRIGFYHGEELENGAYEIGNICIIPEFQGKGIGTKVLREVLENNTHRDVYLRYFKQNPVAGLYARLGFVVCEEQPYHFKMCLKARERKY